MAGKDEERARRLAAALRENLRRRKAQARDVARSPNASAAGSDDSGGRLDDED